MSKTKRFDEDFDMVDVESFSSEEDFLFFSEEEKRQLKKFDKHRDRRMTRRMVRNQKETF